MAKKSFDYKKEIVGLAYLAGAAFFATAYYFGKTLGVLGDFLRKAGKGAFGIAAYAIPVFLLVMALDYFLESEYKITTERLFFVTVFLITVTAIIHVFALPYGLFKDYLETTEKGLTPFNGLGQLWLTGQNGFSHGDKTTVFTGGLIGGSLAFAFVSFADKAGALIFLFTLALSQAILIFRLSVSKVVKKTREKVDDVIRSTAENIKERSQRRTDKDFDHIVGEEDDLEKSKEGSFPAPDFLQDMEDDVKDDLGGGFLVEGREDDSDQNSLILGLDQTDDDQAEVEDQEDMPDLPAGIKRVRTVLDSADDDLDKQDTSDSGDKETDTGKKDTFEKTPKPYVFPPLGLLNSERQRSGKRDSASARSLGQKLEQTLESFGIQSKVVNITSGPVITRFELTPGAGVKVSKIVSLADDIALNLAATGVRIEAPIPGKSAIGIEVPNTEISPVALRSLIDSQEFQNSSSVMTAVLGRDIPGNPVISDLSKMPHLLIAGATGSGKSVCINSILISILYKASPDDVKIIMIDPKVVELTAYNGVPHLLAPVVTNPKKAANTLQWAVAEMTRRYALFAENQVREVQAYNSLVEHNDELEKLPLILIVIDELSDLMATSANEVEDAIARLTAMARAAGIHMIIATQRPSVDVITGVIKANIPSRISFAVSSQVDSRTILDVAGAEKLLGKGDMLYFPVGAAKPIRAQGAYVIDKEVERVTSFLKKQRVTDYDSQITGSIEKGSGANGLGDAGGNGEDELFPDAVEIIIETGYASISLLQRRINIGYPRAARLIDRMHERGFIGGFEGSKPRKVIISREEWNEVRAREF